MSQKTETTKNLIAYCYVCIDYLMRHLQDKVVTKNPCTTILYQNV